MTPELKTLELWISGLRLNPLFFLISRLNIAWKTHLKIFRLIIRRDIWIFHSKVFSSDIINDDVSKLKNKNSFGPNNISTNLMPSIIGPICQYVVKNGYIPTILKTAKSFQSLRLENLINLQITDQLVYFHSFQNF